MTTIFVQPTREAAWVAVGQGQKRLELTMPKEAAMLRQAEEGISPT